MPFERQLYHKHLIREYRVLGCFGDVDAPCAEIGKFISGVHMRKAIRLLFQKWSKSAQNRGPNWPRGRVALITDKNKTRFGTLGRNPLGDFPHFSYVSAHHGPSLTFQISSR